MFTQLIKIIKDLDIVLCESAFPDTDEASDRISLARIQEAETMDLLEEVNKHDLTFEYETFSPDESGGVHCVQFKLNPCLQFDTEEEMLSAMEQLKRIFKET